MMSLITAETLGDQASGDPLSSLVFIALAAAVWWFGVRSWRGQLVERLARYEHERGPFRNLFGTARQYQSIGGACHVFRFVGVGLIVAGVADLIRVIAGEGRDWWLFTAGLVVLAALGLGSVVYMQIYFWFGVPDWLRPPCQRGWEIVDGDLKLVRPDAFHEHPKYRAWDPRDASPDNDPDIPYPGWSIPKASDDE